MKYTLKGGVCSVRSIITYCIQKLLEKHMEKDQRKRMVNKHYILLLMLYFLPFSSWGLRLFFWEVRNLYVRVWETLSKPLLWASMCDIPSFEWALFELLYWSWKCAILNQRSFIFVQVANNDYCSPHSHYHSGILFGSKHTEPWLADSIILNDAQSLTQAKS